MTDNTAPLIVLGAGQRCGSTLVQRLLCSHPQVLIWGEHVGQLRTVLTATQRLRLWSQTNGTAGRNEFTAHGHQGFIANLSPEVDIINKAGASFVETLFAEPAADAGRPIWGFKEVRYQLDDVLLLRDLFPRLRVIQMVRDPRDVLRSLDEWERHGRWSRANTETSLRHWLGVARSFSAAATDTHLRDFILPVRYEELVRFSSAWARAIAEHCCLEAEHFDESVFNRWVHTAGERGRSPRQLREWQDLPESLRELINTEDVQSVAATYGYDLVL